MKRLFPILLMLLMVAACTVQEQIGIEPSVPSVTTDVETIQVDAVETPITEWIVKSEDDMPDIDALIEMDSLRLLDLTALPYTSTETVTELSIALPNCRILWNQMLSDGIFRSDSTELTLPNATAEDINLLSAFSDLQKVDATGSSAFRELYEYQLLHPNVEVHYSMQLGDEAYTEQAEVIAVPNGVDPKAFLDDLVAFPHVQSIDLTESGWDTVWIESLKQSFPELHVRYAVQIESVSFDSDADTLDLRSVSNLTADQLIARLSAFEQLKTVVLPIDMDAAPIRAAYPSVQIVGSFEAFGRTVDGKTEELDLSKTAIQSPEEVEALLSNMPFLQKLVLSDCGLSNEQMETLCASHPDVKFVWTIVIGKRKLRTDAVGFSTKNPSKYTNSNASAQYNESVKKAVRLYEGDIEALKYCTDLEALDLGHNYLTNNDLAVISKLTKLKVLILADNKITDISVLTSLQDLEYIELFMNKIPDLSPLCELPVLQDVNVCNTGVSDLTPLFSLKSAKRLWYAMNPFDREQAKAVKDALPDCLCNYTTRDETGEGWRDDPRYRWMRAYFED